MTNSSAAWECLTIRTQIISEISPKTIELTIFLDKTQIESAEFNC